MRGCALGEAPEEWLELGVAALGQDEELAGEVPQESSVSLSPSATKQPSAARALLSCSALMRF